MIYSFLNKEVSKKLNVTADITFTKEEYNRFVFSLENGSLLVGEQEETDNYGYVSIVKSQTIHLVSGDIVLANSMEGHIVLHLLKMGVKVSLVEYQVVELPPEKRTKKRQAELVYSLVSLD
jgi:hypothetical protein